MDEFPTDFISKSTVEYVYTTHVTHQEQFYVHLDSHSSILEDIMDALESRYTQLHADDKILTNPKLGGLCAAKFTDDNNWYRAKITGLIQNGLVEVQFVDYGNTDYVTRDRLKVLDPDLTQYPVQCYRCALSGVSCEQGFWPPELMVQFEDLVIDKRCKAVFQGKRDRDDVYQIDMYGEDGNYLNKMFGAAEPQVARSVQSSGDLSVKVTVNQNGNEVIGFQPLTWKVGDKIQASVVYVDNPNMFWCQDVAFLNNIIILSEELSRLHMTQEMKPLVNLKPGAICAAKFDEDEAWYRGVVQSVSKANAVVYFVDYGNTETVGLDSVCDLKEEFRDLPALGIRCSLANVKPGGKSWSQDVIHEFETFVMDKEFEIRVVGKQGSLYEVTLFDVEENKDVGSQFQQKTHHAPKTPTPTKVKQPTTAKSASSNVDLPVGSTANVFLSWVDNPSDFWVQVEESSALLDKLSAELQEFYSQPRPEAMSARGAFVIARFSEDQQWYRGVIVKENDDSVKVLFIDYGNTDTIPKHELRKVSHQFGDVDPLAFHCTLAGVKPLRQDNTWSIDAKHFLEELTGNGCQCEVIRMNNACRTVKLSVEGMDVANELISLAVVANASPSHSKSVQSSYPANIKLSQNQSESVVVSFVDSPQSLWVQLSKNNLQLDALMDKLDSHYSEDGGTPISKAEIGQACVARYSADNAWYRAVLVDTSNNGYNVRFVDYGNTEMVTSNLVCVSEPRFLDLPPQAIQCSLSLPGNQQSLSDTLSDMILEKELLMKVISIRGNVAVIDLVDNTQSITDLLAGQMKNGGPVMLTDAKSIPVGSVVQAFASVVLSPSKFYLQLAGIDDELASLMSKISDLYAHEGIPVLKSPKVGMYCVALYDDDQQWYRGKITSVQGNQCSVLFVDYGNEEIIGNHLIKELSPDVTNVPILAYECTLAGVICEAWTESAIGYFESLVMDHELSCSFLNSKSVNVTYGGENIAEKMIAAGHGKTSKVSVSPSASSNKSGGWNEQTSPASAGKPAAWDEKPARKSGFDKGPQREFGGSRGFSSKPDEREGFGGGRKRDFGDSSERSPRKGGWDNESGGGFGRKDGGSGNQRDSNFGSRDSKQSSVSAAEGFQYDDPPSEPEDALLIHIDANGTFYLQLLSMEKDILFLTKRLAGSYKSGGPRLKESPVKGMACCCKFPDDGSMYRSLIEDVKGHDVLVRYVDYGNVAQCSRNDLKFLFPDLLQYKVQAFPCKLRGLTWSLEKAELFGKATLDKDLKVTFTSSSPPFLVDINTADGDVLAIMEGKVAPPAEKLSPKPKSSGGSKPSFGGSKPSFGGSKTSPSQGGFGNKSSKGFGGSSPKQSGSGSPFKKALDFDSPSVPAVPNQVVSVQNAPEGPLSAYISHVAGDGYFYIQLDKDTEMLEKITDMLNTLPGNIPHPNLTAGAACAAVFSEDSAWYRAKILSAEGSKYQVSFIDFGNGDNVVASNIRPLTTELLKSPPLSFQCQFSECDPLLGEAQLKLSEYLLEHQITVQFESKNAPFNVSATTADGQNLQDIVFPSNNFRSQKIPSEVIPAGVSHIEEDGRLFLQFYKDYKAIDQLQASLESAYSSADVEVLSPLEKEMPCCVKSEGDKWYRARILQMTDADVQVGHVDFGHCSTVTPENVKVLLPDFLKQPPYALECRLKDVDSWTEDLLEKFTEMTNEKILNATFHSQTPPFRVSLARSIELDLLGLKGPILESPKKTSPDGKADTCLISETLTSGEDAYIIEVDSEGHLYVQMASREEELQQFSEKLEASLESAQQPESVQEGQLLCAKFSEDEAWYRGTVEKIEDGKHTVRFIDYGNTDCLEKDALAVLPEEMNTEHIAPFAFKGELACQGKLTSETVEKLKNIVMDKTVAVKTISDSEGDLSTVDIFLEGQSVIDMLGLQRASQEESSTATNASLLPGHMTSGEDAYITEVDSEGHLYVQMASREEELQQFSEKLEASLESAQQPESVQECQLLCAKFSEDEAWYRGQVEKIEEGKHTVRFIDYGNTDCLEKDALAVLPEEMNTEHIAPFAFKGELACQGKLTSETVEKLKNIVMDKTVAVKTISDSDEGGLSMVEIFLEGQSVIDMLGLQRTSQEGSTTATNASLLPGHMAFGEDAYITEVDSEGHLYVQMASREEELQQFSEKLEVSLESAHQPESVQEGQLLCAKFSEDEAWYRGTVEKIEDGKHTVRFIDYGNTDCLEKDALAVLPEEMNTEHIAPFAFKGELACQPKLTPELAGKLRDVVTDKTVAVKIVSDIDDGLRKVEVFLEGQAVSEILGLKTSSEGAGELSSIVGNMTEMVSGTPSQEPGCKRMTITVSCVVSPSKFFIQLDEPVPSKPEVAELSDYISNLPHGTGTVQDVNVGDVLAALCYEDECWYRGLVVDLKDDESIVIFFMDHGCSEVVSDNSSLCHLPSDMKEMPGFVREASLFGIKPTDTNWTDAAIESFKSMVEGKSMLADILWQDNKSCVVQLLDLGTPVHQILIDKGLGIGSGEPANTMAQRLFSDASDSVLEDSQALDNNNHSKVKISSVLQTLEDLAQVPAFVSHYDSPSLFWCQLVSSTDVLDEISDILQTAYNVQPNEDDRLTSDIFPNAIVACRFADDELYYRAKVLNLNSGDGDGDKILVRFIDYGNCGQCVKEDVFRLRDDFYKYPVQAFQCSLDGVSPVNDRLWQSETCSRFSELVTDQEVLLKLVGKKQDGSALVELVLQERSVASILVEENLAKFSESPEPYILPTKAGESGKDVSGMDTLEITQPIMESTAMINDTTSSIMSESSSTQPMVSFEEIYDGCYKMFRLSPRCNYDVYVSDDELPNAFCVQLKEFRNQYNALMAEIAEYAASDEAKDSSDWVIKLSEPCLVKHLDEWYRGLIRDRNSDDKWTVRAVDCGWDVSADVSTLKEIPERFLDLATQAVPCYLAGIVSVEANWDENALAFFSDFVKDRQMRIYVLETGEDGKYGVFMNDLDTSTTQSVNRAFVDCGFAEVVPGSYIDVTFDMERTLNTEMLNDLEESFNELGLNRENNLDENETDASSSKADTFTKAFEDSSCLSKPVEGTVDQNFYKLVQIQTLSRNSEQMSKEGEENSKDANLVAKNVAFSIATAVERIDELGCIDLFPEESFPTFPDMSSILSEKNDTSGVPSPQVPLNHQSGDESVSNGADIAVQEKQNNASNIEDMQENRFPQDNMKDLEACMTSESTNDIIGGQSAVDYCVAMEIDNLESDFCDFHVAGACAVPVNSDSEIRNQMLSGGQNVSDIDATENAGSESVKMGKERPSDNNCEDQVYTPCHDSENLVEVESFESNQGNNCEIQIYTQCHDSENLVEVENFESNQGNNCEVQVYTQCHDSENLVEVKNFESNQGNDCEAQFYTPCHDSENLVEVEKFESKQEVSLPPGGLGKDFEIKQEVDNTEEGRMERVIGFDQHMSGSSIGHPKQLPGEEAALSQQDGVRNKGKENENGKVSPSETYVSCVDDGLQTMTSSDESGQTLHPEEDLVSKMNDFDSVEVTEKTDSPLGECKDEVDRDVSNENMVADRAEVDSESMSAVERPTFCPDGIEDSSGQVGCKGSDQGLQSLDNTLDEYESCSEVLSDADQNLDSYSEDVHDGVGLDDESSFSSACPDTSNVDRDPSYFDTSSLVFTDSQGDVSVDDSSFQSYTSAYWDNYSVSSSSTSDNSRGEDTSATDFSTSNVNASNTMDSYDEVSTTDFSCSTVNDSDVTDFSFSFNSSNRHDRNFLNYSDYFGNDGEDGTSITESSFPVVDVPSDPSSPSSAAVLSSYKSQGNETDSASISINSKYDGSLGMLEISTISLHSDLKCGEAEDASNSERDPQLLTGEGKDVQRSSSSCILKGQRRDSDVKHSSSVDSVSVALQMSCTTKKVNGVSERSCADFNSPETVANEKDYCTSEGGLVSEQAVEDDMEEDTKAGHKFEESLGNKMDEVRKDSPTNMNDKFIQACDSHPENIETNIQEPGSDAVVKDICSDRMFEAALPSGTKEDIWQAPREDIPLQNIEKESEHDSHHFQDAESDPPSYHADEDMEQEEEDRDLKSEEVVDGDGQDQSGEEPKADSMNKSESSEEEEAGSENDKAEEGEDDDHVSTEEIPEENESGGKASPDSPKERPADETEDGDGNDATHSIDGSPAKNKEDENGATDSAEEKLGTTGKHGDDAVNSAEERSDPTEEVIDSNTSEDTLEANDKEEDVENSGRVN